MRVERHGRLLLAWVLFTCGVGSGCHSARLTEQQVAALRRRCTTELKLVAGTTSDERLRAYALWGLSHAAAVQVSPWLLQGLFDDKPEVRFVAVMTLLHHDDIRCVQSVLHLTEDPNDLVRAAALLFVVRRGARDRSAELANVLLSSSDICGSEWSAQLIAEASAVIPPENWGKTPPQPSAEDSNCVNTVQLLQLAKGDEQTVRDLMHTASTPGARRQIDAIRLLGRAGDPQVVVVLEQQLQECSRLAGRLEAAHSLSQFGVDSGMPLVKRFLAARLAPTARQVESSELLILSYRTCAQVGDEQALAKLAVWYDRPQPELARIACAGAILELLPRESTQRGVL